MKLVTAAVFGIGYVVGARAGRERYQQIRDAVRSASENFDLEAARQRLGKLAAQLDGYSAAAPRRHTERA